MRITLTEEEKSLIGRPYKSRNHSEGAKRAMAVLIGFVVVNLIAILFWIR